MIRKSISTKYSACFISLTWFSFSLLLCSIRLMFSVSSSFFSYLISNYCRDSILASHNELILRSFSFLRKVRCPLICHKRLSSPLYSCLSFPYIWRFLIRNFILFAIYRSVRRVPLERKSDWFMPMSDESDCTLLSPCKVLSSIEQELMWRLT